MRSLFIFLSLFLSTVGFSDNFETTKTSTVKVTNDEMNHGGSGTVIKSYSSASYILTNAHVCGVVENGGKVITTAGNDYAVTSYVTSKQHDLCLVKVAQNLKVDTKLAEDSPKEGESVVVSGHPYLMPHINAPGHITGKMDIQIVTGVESCTKEEYEKYPFLCSFYGMPTVTNYETRVVSSIIAPGNSGSGVYNTDSELVGVVFAGQGRGLCHGIIVPYEYVRNFLRVELKTLKWKSPKNSYKYSELNESFNKNITSKRTNNLSIDKVPANQTIAFPAIFSSKLDNLFEIYKCSIDGKICTRK